MSVDTISFFVKRLQEVGDSALLEAKYMNMSVNDVLTAYEISKLQPPMMVKKNTWGRGSRGWGNGYVKVVPNHRFYGKHYDDIDVVVHHGLTFSEVIQPNDVDGWPEGHWIGFDTAHYGDTLEKWPKSMVVDETKELLKQVYLLK